MSFFLSDGVDESSRTAPDILGASIPSKGGGGSGSGKMAGHCSKHGKITGEGRSKMGGISKMSGGDVPSKSSGASKMSGSVPPKRAGHEKHAEV